MINRCEARLEKVQEERLKQAQEHPAPAKAQKRTKDETIHDGKVAKKEPAAKKVKVASNEKSDMAKQAKNQPTKNRLESSAVANPVPVRQAPDDPALQARTVFISNLDFKVTEDEIREAMSSSGNVTDVRLVGDFKRRSKGYCYVEFSTEVCPT